MTESRTETGGPTRTSRSEIAPAVSANRKKEPVLLLDLSTSMDWEASPGGPEWDAKAQQGGRRGVVIGALRQLVIALEKEDTEAAAEQAGGSDEMGGLLTFGFASSPTEIGDLNSSNLERRLNSITWGGGTVIMPAWKQALADYDEEYGDRDPADQPTHLVLVLTDGEATDFRDFEPVLMSASAKRVFVVAVVGHGDAHDATVREYTNVAAQNKAADKFGKQHVVVVSFDSVTDPSEIAADLITLVS